MRVIPVYTGASRYPGLPKIALFALIVPYVSRKAVC